MDFDEIFSKWPKRDREQVTRFGSDLDHCLNHLDPCLAHVCALRVFLFINNCVFVSFTFGRTITVQSTLQVVQWSSALATLTILIFSTFIVLNLLTDFRCIIPKKQTPYSLNQKYWSEPRRNTETRPEN